MKKKLLTAGKPAKRRALALVLALAAVLALAGTALACGHHGKKGQTQVTVCTVEGCGTAGRHVHNGVTYCGYAHADGVCNGRCLALCAVEGCTVSGRHSHNGAACCGNRHEAGFCDGTCAAGVSTSYGHHGGLHH